MRVEVVREVGSPEAEWEAGELEGRHESFEALRQRVFVDRCSDPQAADDYVVWKALREGGAIEDRTVFDTPAVFRALTPRRVELLGYLHGNEVGSIRELAAKLGRDYKNTYDDVAALLEWGLVAVRREGKNRRPVPLVTTLRVGWEK